MAMYDVIVVGGGPSGLNASSRLAEKGLDVLILERKSALGEHVVCTGIVSEEAFKEFDLDRDTILKDIQRVQWISPYGSSVDYEHPNIFAHIVDRENFDRSLGDRAFTNGVNIELNCEVVDVSVRKSDIVVSTKIEDGSTKDYRTQQVIISTGVNYHLNKKLGLGYPKSFLNGVQAEIYFDDVDCTQVYVGQDIAHGAFAWVVPIGGRVVRIGLMTEDDPRDSFERLLERLIEGKDHKLEMKNVLCKKIAQGLVSKTYGDRVLALGEAAGQVKTTTGGGIYFGLLCSEIASDVIKKGFDKGDLSAKVLSDYERLWKKSLQKEILFGYYTRKFFAKFNNNQLEKLFHKGQTNGVIPLLREKGNFDWHSELILLLMKRIPFWQIIKSQFNDYMKINKVHEYRDNESDE
jgi:geranylgeranyl reductase family protein